MPKLNIDTLIHELKVLILEEIDTIFGDNPMNNTGRITFLSRPRRIAGFSHPVSDSQLVHFNPWPRRPAWRILLHRAAGQTRLPGRRRNRHRFPLRHLPRLWLLLSPNRLNRHHSSTSCLCCRRLDFPHNSHKRISRPPRRRRRQQENHRRPPRHPCRRLDLSNRRNKHLHYYGRVRICQQDYVLASVAVFTLWPACRRRRNKFRKRARPLHPRPHPAPRKRYHYFFPLHRLFRSRRRLYHRQIHT